MESPNQIQPRWLSLKEAAVYSHIGKSHLVELAADGRVKGFQDPDSKRSDWIFDRISLDAYRESQYNLPEIRQKALAIMRTVQV
ncbi:MAG: hypothetical protein ACLP9S_13875 [Syntrophales bacterium]